MARFDLLRATLAAVSIQAAWGAAAAAQEPAPIGTLSSPEYLAAAHTLVRAYDLPCVSVATVSVYDGSHMQAVCSSGERYAMLMGSPVLVVPWVSVAHLLALRPDPVASARAEANAQRSVATGQVPSVGGTQTSTPAGPSRPAPGDQWQVDVQQDDFAGTKQCSIVSADGRIEIFTDGLRNQTVGFHLGRPVSQPVYRVDNRRPGNFDFLVMSASIQSYMRTQWADGLVLIPYKEVARGRKVAIRGSADGSPEDFDISGIQAGMRAAEAKGCLRTWIWNVG